jgi:hypothetical protein
MILWEQLMELEGGLYLSDRQDSVKWAFEKNGEYSTKSMYRWWTFEGVSDPQLKKIWYLKIPGKIRIILWQVIDDRLPTREQNIHRKGSTTSRCPIYQDLEPLIIFLPNLWLILCGI